MVESEDTTTLIGRKETHGRPYPGLLEKLILVILVVVAVMVGQWMWTESDWSALVLWPATVCGLPLSTLITTEILSRIVQVIHANSD
jgi:uncharacterized protein (DUF983 family)